jgi:hypothetical protein
MANTKEFECLLIKCIEQERLAGLESIIKSKPRLWIIKPADPMSFVWYLVTNQNKCAIINKAPAH